MPLGRLKKAAIKRTTKKAIKEVMESVDRTLQRHPDLSVEDALRMIDRKKGIFFPDEQIAAMDLKSLFTLIIWKSYRYAHLSDPDASSSERREFVAGLVHDYLSDDKVDKKFKYKKVLKPALLGIGLSVTLIAVGAAVSFYPSKTLVKAHPTVNRNKNVADSQNSFFRYNGFSTDQYRKMALINTAIYREGDILGAKDGYILKRIYPNHIIVQNRTNQSEFYVLFQ